MKKVLALCGALLLSTSLTASRAHAQAPHATVASPQLVNLRLTDLGPGFSATFHRFWTNQEAASSLQIPVSTLTSHGRLLSYEEAFLSEVPSKTPLLYVDVDVSLYQRPAGAMWDYQSARNEILQGALQGHVTVLNIPTVGSASTTAIGYQTIQGTKVVLTMLHFVRSNYRVSVFVYSLPSKPQPFAAILPLARTIDHRIQAPPARSIPAPRLGVGTIFRPRP